MDERLKDIKRKEKEGRYSSGVESISLTKNYYQKLFKMAECAQQENQRYKEALEEIKEFALYSDKGANLELIGQMDKVFRLSHEALEGEKL
ncbi:hypothetical protein GCM10008931_43580 [Oceanobacillus oncorhynchi subsp. oncorhynchi]|uniref:hypothetical protein n=1 Tax=Oceanobacillus oncorhynchi TaxID=545501 RepID=UPI0031DD7350